MLKRSSLALAKRTSKNQLTLPNVTPVNPGGAFAVRARLAEMGISDVDVAEAVSWARRV